MWWSALKLLSPAVLCAQEAGGEGSDSVIQQLFGLGLHTRLLCAESEETIEEDSTVYELKCNITVDVNHLTEGIRLGLQDDREKNSEKLGRLALFAVSSPSCCYGAPPKCQYRDSSATASCTGWAGPEALAIKEKVAVQGSSAISRLPQYLTAQMVRFFYKVDTQQKAKILRKVSNSLPTLAACLWPVSSLKIAKSGDLCPSESNQ